MLCSRHLVSLSITWCVALGVASDSLAQAVAPPAVRQQIAQHGSAHVIVGVDLARFELEGRLSVDQVDAQLSAIRAAVDQVLGASPVGVTVGHRYERIPFFAARVDAAALTTLENSPSVNSISEDVVEQATLAESVPLVNAPAAWTAGATGAGWKIAILDTGVQTNHPFLAGKTYAEGCFSNQSGAGANVSLCPGGGVGNSTTPGSGANCAVSGCNHGTHVAGIAVGSGAGLNGVAPNAQLIALQVFTRFDDSATCGISVPCVRSWVSDQVAALDYVLTLAGPDNVNQIAAANLSLGGGQYTSQAECDVGAGNPARRAAIDNLRSIGIATVAASGNNGFLGALNAPACISSAVSVGSTTKGDVMVSSSNRAPFLSLLAPGSTIVSSVPIDAYAVMNGTSMASPHVAGAWAVMKQANPAASVTDVLAALRNTGVLIVDNGSQASYPRINVDAARMALVGAPPGQPAITSVAQNGATITIAWTSGAGGVPTTHRLDFFCSDGTWVASVTVGATTNHSLSLPAGVRGTFGVSVTASNLAGASPSSSIFNFTIEIGPPGQPTVTSVAESGNALTINWMSGAGAAPTSHRLDFLQGGASFASVTSGAATSVSLMFPAGLHGAFAVRVTAFNGAIAGPPSPLFDFIIGPACTLPTAPVVSGGIVNGTATISWSAVAGATSYIVSAGTTAGGTNLFPATNIGPTTSVGASGLPAGFQAFVRVIAVNACGQQSPPTDFLLQ